MKAVGCFQSSARALSALKTATEVGEVTNYRLTLGSLYFSLRWTLRQALSAFFCAKAASLSILDIRKEKKKKKSFFKILIKYCLLQWPKIFLKSCNLLRGTKGAITTKWCSGAQIPESWACSRCTSLKYYGEWNTACLEFVSVQAVIAHCSNSNTQSRKFMLVPCLSHQVHLQWWQYSSSANRTFF